jgi:SSS family solute:Na+ symporter
MAMTDAMASGEPLLGPNGLYVILGYLMVLILLGIAGRLASRENSLADFFLAGRGLGFAVLLFTLFATQYSGNTLIGLSANAYRSGFGFLVAVVFMMGVIGVYVIYAPRLFRLSHVHGYITLSDYIQHRYRSRTLSTLISVSGIVALSNFLITNLKAAGEIVMRVSGGAVDYAYGIVGLGLVILIYETLGGLRSVAWTDVLQGLLLLVGCTSIFVVTVVSLGGLEGAAERLHAVQPAFWAPPDLAMSVKWLSTVLVVSLGAAMYPQAVQRIYAARDGQVLKRSLQIMVFLPLVTTLFMIAIGLLGNINHPHLSGADSEGITLMVLRDFARLNPAAGWVVVLFVGAVFAAIMSSADSALLSVASSVTQDIARPLARISNESQLTRLGKIVSALVMIGAVVLAIRLPQSIWQLIEVKTELLAQTAPALLLGLHWKALRGRSVLIGFVVGIAVTIFFLVGSFLAPELIPGRPLGVHAGLVGLLANLMVIVLSDSLLRRRG